MEGSNNSHPIAQGGASDSALPRVDINAAANQPPDVPRRRLRRSSMTGRITGPNMRRGSMASQVSQISQTSASTPGSGAGADAGGGKDNSNNRPRRARRRNSMLSTASHDSVRSRASRASHNIDKLATEIKDLQECREHELQLAEEEKQRLRLERQQSVESANMLEDLIETASMADGAFDIDAAIRRHEQQQQGGSSGESSIPVDIMIEADLRGESAATFEPTDHIVAYEEPVKDGDDAIRVHTSSTRRGRRRTRKSSRSQSSSASDGEGSVDKLNYSENKIQRISATRRSRSMSVDRSGSTGGRRKPRRGRRATRSSSRDPGGDSGASGETRIRSQSLDVGGGGGYRSRHLRKRPANNMRKLEVAAIADLQKKIRERKDEIEKIRNRMELRIESAEEISTMMDETTTMQGKNIADLKVEILKTRAALRFSAVRRQDSDAIKKGKMTQNTGKP